MFPVTRGLCAVLVCGLALAAAGCAAQIQRAAVPATLVQDASVPGLAHARFWGDEAPKDVLAFVREHMPGMGRPAGRVQNKGPQLVEYLALSGGAGDGAFGAGLLVGWSDRGDRPTFEVVTGVSAGALIAPFAFLGPAYDRKLREMWTKYDTQSVATPQVLAGLFGAEAVADSKPLAELIAKHIDRKMLDHIAREYRSGRGLLVLTTNLDAQRPVIWNMGEIATNSHPYALELFRQVILASASLPGIFPPVHVRVRAGDRMLEEMHVDGGPTRQVFLAPSHLSLHAFDPLYPRPPERRIFVIKNGKLTPEYEAVQANTLAISARSLFTLTKSQSIGDINRIYATAQRDGAAFKLASIPAGFNAPSNQPFDPDYMKALFNVGYQLGRQGSAWVDAPPEAASSPAAPAKMPHTAGR